MPRVQPAEQVTVKEGLPALDVKVQKLWHWPTAVELAAEYGCTEAQADTALEHLWDIGVADFWATAELYAEEYFGSAVRVYSAGRSDGWLQVAGLPDPLTWTVTLRRRWANFERKIRAEIEYRSSRKWAEETIREGEMLPPPPTDAEMVRELSAALQGAIDEMTPLLRHSADFPEWYTSGLAALAKLPEGRDTK